MRLFLHMKKYLECFAEFENAPQAVGPYSPAVRAGNIIFISGQVGIDPTTNKLIEGGIEAETKQVLKNLSAILTGLGLSFHDVARAGIFLTDLKNFQLVNGLYGEAMGSHRPARATVEVSGLPLGACVEIELQVFDPS